MKTHAWDLYPVVLQGKVRNVHEVDDSRLVMIATDRISAYDRVMPTEIPDKGRVLTALSVHWFEQTADIVPNHLLGWDGLQGMLVTKLKMLPIECVARGYLAGSGWRDYVETGRVCGHRLRPGLRQSDRLPVPIFTPATKATEGHDLNIDLNAARSLVGRELLETLERVTIELYERAAARCLEVGLILADTKFEFGTDSDGTLVLGDEAITPDSSRLWPADQWRPGESPSSFDKQFLRDWLDSIGWDHQSQPPSLPHEVVEGTRQRYLEAFRRITGEALL